MNWNKLRQSLLKGIEALKGAAYETEEDRAKAVDTLFDGMKTAYEAEASEGEAALEKARAAYAKVGVDAAGDTLSDLHRAAMGDYAKGIQSLEALEVQSRHFIADRERAADNRKQANGGTKVSDEAWDTFAHVAFANNRNPKTG